MLIKNANISSNHDSGKALTWFILLIVVIGLVTGFKFGTAYFNHESFEKQVEEMAETYLLENGYDLVGNIINTAETDYGIILETEDIKWRLNDLGTQVSINFNYISIVYLILTTYPLRMNVSITKDMTKQKEMLDNVKERVEENLKKANEKSWDEARELSQ